MTVPFSNEFQFYSQFNEQKNEPKLTVNNAQVKKRHQQSLIQAYKSKPTVQNNIQIQDN